MSKDVRSAVALIVQAAIVASAIAGCATGKIAFTRATVVPAEVSLGKSSILCVSITDPREMVDSVIATVREFPEMEVELFDDGEEGDRVAGDGIWSFRIEVPMTAPPGTYHFDIRAYAGDGTEISVKSGTGEHIPLSAEAAFTIVY